MGDRSLYLQAFACELESRTDGSWSSCRELYEIADHIDALETERDEIQARVERLERVLQNIMESVHIWSPEGIHIGDNTRCTPPPQPPPDQIFCECGEFWNEGDTPCRHHRR